VKRILLKTTIPPIEDDWHVGRFALLRRFLSGLAGSDGRPLYQVQARDRVENAAGDDVDLCDLGRSSFDQLWLFAVDVGGGLTRADCDGIDQFRALGGGCLVTRDHQDMGACLLGLGELGLAHHFRSRNPEPDLVRHRLDDDTTPSVSWPNYHSGRNGDAQEIRVVAPAHELAVDRGSGRPLRWLPAHPHEGAVGVPPGAERRGRVIITGRSLRSGHTFNLAVAFDGQRDAAGRPLGRAVAQSTFHHFCDYNWDPRSGCPSFVGDEPGTGMLASPEATADTLAYVANLARWLS
jgi:hypothetical protein